MAAVGADVQVVVAETGRAVAGQRLLVLEQVEVLVVLDEGVVDLAGAQGGHDVRLVGDDAHDQLVGVGQPLLPVARVALEDHLLLDLPVVEDERAGAEGSLVEVAVLLHAGLAHDEPPEPAQRRHQRRERLLGDELHRVLADRLDLVDRAEVRLAGGGFLQQPVECELHVGGGELHALPELERPRQSVGADLPGLRELRHRGHVGLEAHELVVGQRRAAAARQGRHQLRVEAGRLGRLGGDQRAAAGRLGAGRPGERERAERQAGGLEQFATSQLGHEGLLTRWGRGRRAGRRR